MKYLPKSVASIVVLDDGLAALSVGGRFGASDSAKFISAIRQSVLIRTVANVDGSILNRAGFAGGSNS